MTPFSLVDARSAAEAVALLEAHGAGAQIIAVGGDLLGLLKDGVEGPTLQRPHLLINLATAHDLAEIRVGPQELRLGAMATLADLAGHRDLPSIISEATRSIASPQLRARTTLGGNLLQRPRCWYFRHPDIDCFKKGGTDCPATGGPAEAYPGALMPGRCRAGHPSDLAPVLIALAAEAELLGSGGTRRLPLAALYDGAEANPTHEALLGATEILTALVIPRADRLQAFEKVAPRPANEFAWASAALTVCLTQDHVAEARLALGGIAPAPVLAPEAARLMTGRALRDMDPDAIAAAALPGSALTDGHRARAAACRAAVRRAVARIVDGKPAA